MAQISKFNPWYPSFMERFMEKDFRNLLHSFVSEDTVPAVNVKETEKEFLVEVAAPGMKKDDFDIEMEENTLIISCEQREEKKEKEGDYTRREFNYRSFHRTFDIPQHLINKDQIDAKYENGVLFIHLPKTEQAKTRLHRKIKVN